MKIEDKKIIELSPEDVKKILIDHFENQGIKGFFDVDFQMNREYYNNKEYKIVFSGAKIEVGQNSYWTLR